MRTYGSISLATCGEMIDDGWSPLIRSGEAVVQALEANHRALLHAESAS